MRRGPACLCLMVLPLGCGDRAPEEASSEPGGVERAAEVGPVSIEPLGVGPVSFFQDACARCHGDMGWGYAEGFTEAYTREELKQVVHEMVIGPAQSELGERELSALTDLHYAIDAVDGKFVALVKGGQRDALPGSDDLSLQGRGAWAAVGPSGRVFGEKQTGEVEPPR